MQNTAQTKHIFDIEIFYVFIVEERHVIQNKATLCYGLLFILYKKKNQITKKDMQDDLKHVTHDIIYSTKTQHMHNYQQIINTACSHGYSFSSQ